MAVSLVTPAYYLHQRRFKAGRRRQRQVLRLRLGRHIGIIARIRQV